jgi:hypothetical protein
VLTDAPLCVLPVGHVDGKASGEGRAWGTAEANCGGVKALSSGSRSGIDLRSAFISSSGKGGTLVIGSRACETGCHESSSQSSRSWGCALFLVELEEACDWPIL